MKRILLVCVLVFVFTVCALCQAPPAPINIPPMINLDGFFDAVREWFTDVLKKQWLLLLSLFFLWLCWARVLGMLEGRRDRLRREQRIRRYVEAAEERQEAARRVREREVARVREQTLQRIAYIRDQELQRIVTRDGGTFADIGGDRYVRSESYGVVTYQTFEQWQRDHAEELAPVLAMGNENDGRQYENTVDRDYQLPEFAAYAPREESGLVVDNNSGSFDESQSDDYVNTVESRFDPFESARQEQEYEDFEREYAARERRNRHRVYDGW